MKTTDAIYIFRHINSDEFTDLEKGKAIKILLEMPTLNSIRKDELLLIIDYLWNLIYEEEKDEV